MYGDCHGQACGKNLHSEVMVPQDETNQCRFQFRPAVLSLRDSYHPIMELLCQISAHVLLYSHLNLGLWKLCRSIVSLSDPSISNDYVLRK